MTREVLAPIAGGMSAECNANFEKRLSQNGDK